MGFFLVLGVYNSAVDMTVRLIFWGLRGFGMDYTMEDIFQHGSLHIQNIGFGERPVFLEVTHISV